MNASRIRVWVEEVEPPALLLFSWKLPDDTELNATRAFESVLMALETSDGVVSAEPHNDGILVEIDPDSTTRYKLATVIRHCLAPDDPGFGEEPTRTRVWAEDLATNMMRLTWIEPGASDEGPEPHERRAVAARLAVTPGIKSSTTDPEGALITYDPEKLDRGGLAQTVRTALDNRTPLRDRADDLMRRAPTYGNLVRKLAMDGRVSPLPDAAKQAISSRASGGGGNMAARTALRFVPGAAWITRIQTLLPMLTELSKWSGEADPEIVDEHLAAVGLDRDTLRVDTITAHEIKFLARESAFETGAEIGEKASAGARQAISAGRDFIDSIRESMSTPGDESTDDSQADTPAPEESLLENKETEKRDPTGTS